MHADRARPLDKTAEVLAWYRNLGRAELIRQLTICEDARHPVRKFNCDALMMLAERDLVEPFIQWAVHPTAGFLIPSTKARPLPDAIHALFDDYVKKQNTPKLRQHLRENGKIRDMNRRESLQMMVGGGLIGALMGAIGGHNILPEDASIDQQIGAGLASGVIGATGGAVSGKTLASIQAHNRAEQNTEDNPVPHDLYIDDMTRAAGKLLEKIHLQTQAKHHRL